MKKYNYIIYFVLLFILLISLSYSLYYNYENFDKQNNIIIYIHICQKEGWKRSFTIIMDSIRESNLYDSVDEFRLGVVNEDGYLIQDELLNDKKFKIIHVGHSNEYERNTLLHMKKSSYVDPDNTLYCYLHTKGIRHFNTPFEKPILDWIYDMLKYNIYYWEDVVNKLKIYETYGCNYNNLHYSGNFWWATKEHIKKLPDQISTDYVDPENWILTNNTNAYCANNCGDDFVKPYPDNIY